jgi:5-methylthioadenosine/S-adenosylhomocysteine deaminase
LLAAHCVWLEDREIESFKQSGAKIAHNPVSNLKLASGISRLTDLLSNGITVGIGTDGVTSNNTLDMFESMKFASLLQKFRTGDASAIPARTAFELATICGSKALGLDREIGSIQKGKRADIILVDLNSPRFFPVIKESVFAHLVYAARGEDVDTVIVNGKILMQGKKIKIKGVPEDLADRAQQEAEKLVQELVEITGLKR